MNYDKYIKYLLNISLVFVLYPILWTLIVTNSGPWGITMWINPYFLKMIHMPITGLLLLGITFYLDKRLNK